MKFLSLNKKRHAVRSFNDKPVDLSDIRTAIEVATLAPSAHNMQPWKFVVVTEKKDQLAELGFKANGQQIRDGLQKIFFRTIQLLLCPPPPSEYLRERLIGYFCFLRQTLL